MKKQPITRILFIISVIIFVILIVLLPSVSAKGAAEGILICGQVIIPSLFPFTVCILMIIKSGILNKFNFLTPITNKIFHINGYQFCLFILSFLGGFPIGAKLLNEGIKTKSITPKNAGIMLNYCINGGPAFIISAIGSGIIGSQKVGVILLASQIISSLIIAVFCGFFIKENNEKPSPLNTPKSITENFVSSVADASSSILSVCGYIILFSTIGAFITYLQQFLPYLKYVSVILEVTNAAIKIKNVFLIAFSLGFASLCIWFQVFAIGKNIKINLKTFVFFRILQGLLTTFLTAVLLKITGIALPTVSQNISFSLSYGSIPISVSLFSMSIILLISLFSEKEGGKTLKDLI